MDDTTNTLTGTATDLALSPEKTLLQKIKDDVRALEALPGELLEKIETIFAKHAGDDADGDLVGSTGDTGNATSQDDATTTGDATSSTASAATDQTEVASQ